MSWEKAKLGDIIAIKKGTYITKKEAKEGPYPVIHGGREPGYYIDKYNHIGKAIVISRSGASAGYVSFWNEPIFVTDGFLVEPKDCVSIEFLYYLLKFKEPELQGKQGGSAIPHVNPQIINAVEIFLPSSSVQENITTILSAYDDLIENNQKQIKLLEEAAQRLYKEWFVDLRFPGHETTPITDGIPEGWKNVVVTDLLEIKYGKDHKALEDGNIPVYGSGGVMRKVNKILHSGESVLIPRKGSLNNILLVSGDFWTIDTMFFSIPRKPNVAKYVYLFLSGVDMYAMNIGAAVPSMTVKILDSMKVLCPSTEMLAQFEKVVGPYFSMIELLKIKNESLAEARNLLLPKLMNGEIEV